MFANKRLILGLLAACALSACAVSHSANVPVVNPAKNSVTFIQSQPDYHFWDPPMQATIYTDAAGASHYQAAPAGAGATSTSSFLSALITPFTSLAEFAFALL